MRLLAYLNDLNFGLLKFCLAIYSTCLEPEKYSDKGMFPSILSTGKNN
jgi:hypothetical protein